MSVLDQLALDLPGLAPPAPDVLAGLSSEDQAVVLEMLTGLIVKTIAAGLVSADREASDE
jgi:hypothetical protein